MTNFEYEADCPSTIDANMFLRDDITPRIPKSILMGTIRLESLAFQLEKGTEQECIRW